MAGLNKGQFIGNLGRDAELKDVGGTKLCSFSIGVTETWKGQDGNRQERTTWIDCALWGNRGEALAKYLVKGKQVFVEGSVSSRAWLGKSDNEPKSGISLRVRDIELLGGRDGVGSPPEGFGDDGGTQSNDFKDPEIPF